MGSGIRDPDRAVEASAAYLNARTNSGTTDDRNTTAVVTEALPAALGSEVRLGSDCLRHSRALETSYPCECVRARPTSGCPGHDVWTHPRHWLRSIEVSNHWCRPPLSPMAIPGGENDLGMKSVECEADIANVSVPLALYEGAELGAAVVRAVKAKAMI